MDLADFWQKLVGNVVFLLVMLPLFGAAMVAASAGLGREAIRRTALTNVLLTCALSVVMVLSYEPDRRTEDGDPAVIQMATHLSWLKDGATVRESPEQVGRSGTPSYGSGRPLAVAITVGVDGLSLWPIAATCWLLLAAVLAGADVDRERPAAFYTALLVMQGMLVGAFAALDGVFFLFCLEAAVLPVWYLLSTLGRHDRQSAGRKLFVFQTAGSLLVFVGLMGLSVTVAARGGTDAANMMFLIPRVLAQAPAVAVWIAAALVLGFWTKLALFPLHAWFPAAFASAPTSLRILLTGAVLPLGGYGLARFVLPLAADGGPEGPVPVAGSLQAVAIAGAVYFGLLALANSDLSRLLACAGLCHFALATAGLTSGNVTGATGGVLHVLNVGLTMAALAILVGWLERRTTSDPDAGSARVNVTWPCAVAFFTVAALALIGLPLLNGFAGLMLILWGVSAGTDGPRLIAVAACLVAWLLCAWAIVAMLMRTLKRELQGRNDLTRSELVCLVPLAVVIVWIGVWPQFFTSRIEPTLRQQSVAEAASFGKG